MARGSAPGERRGGRQLGTPNTKTRERQAIIDKALAKGITPLEVMLENMRHFRKLAISAEAALSKLSADKVAGMEPEEQFKYLLAEVKKTVGLRNMAEECARDAGPFVHPRLTAISGPTDGSAIPVRFIMEGAPPVAGTT